jgi:hypothetical protein
MSIRVPELATATVQEPTAASPPEPIAGPELTTWLDEHDDTDIDLIMDRACSAIRGDTTELEIIGSIDEVHAELEPEIRGDLTSGDFFLLTNSGFRCYFPNDAGPLLGTG